MDTYFRGNSHEVEFCKSARAGGNHLVAVTAAGQPLGDGKGQRGHVRLREKDLAPLLATFRALPKDSRKPQLSDPKLAIPPKRPVPKAPENGLVVRGYCTYLKADENGKPRRAKRLYYQQNPDARAAETQNDMLWFTEAEWRSLIPQDSTPGTKIKVPQEVQRRFFSTIGIDYMEGSVKALPLREWAMTIVVEKTGQSFASTNDLKPSIYKGVTVFTRVHADVSSVGFNVGPLAEILDVHQVIKHQIKDFFHADSLPAMHVRFE